METPAAVTVCLPRVDAVRDDETALKERIVARLMWELHSQQERIVEQFLVSGAMPRDISIRTGPIQFIWSPLLINDKWYGRASTTFEVC